MFGNSVFFRTLRLVLISARPYYQNARIDRGIFFGFRRNLTNDSKLQVRPGFLGVPLVSAFSLYFINLSGTLCGPPIPGRGFGDRWRPGLCIVFRGVVLSVGALSNMSGFLLSVGALYNNLMYPHPI